MSIQEDYLAVEAEIVAISDDDALTPGIPIDVYLQEAENLFQWATDDKDKLIARGLPATSIDALPVASGAGRYTQSLWFKDRNVMEAAQKEWREKSPAAYDLRDDLLDELDFAFYDDPDLMERIDNAREGNSKEDMIQDLNDLAALGRENPEPLAATNFDVTKLDLADATAAEMTDILARANGETIDVNSGRLLRDKAYTHLKKYVDEVRRYGRFVFRNDKNRLKGYRSYYRLRHRGKKTEETPVKPESQANEIPQ